MEKKEIIWYSFERDAVPAALHGIVDTRMNGPAITFGAPRPREGDVVVGYCERPNYQQRIVPLLIVTNEDSTPEVFSWLSTYAPETFPVSQFARVISDNDWEMFVPKDVRDSQKYEHEDRWASLILGELLAQGEGDAELSGIPFSRASACFSTAVARTSLIYPTKGAGYQTCISRLRKIEADYRFVRRPISISELAKAWAAMQHHEYRKDDYHDSVDARVMEAVDILLAHQGISSHSKGVHLDNYPDLSRNAIEERVLAFQKIVADAGINLGGEITDSRVNAVIAAAAFLVGRGTSHIFLLRRINKTFPSAILWFGVLAAFAGPKCWDAHWGRAVKGIEKHLRSQFQWEDPSLSDLCWHEFNWLATIYKDNKIFESLSKNTPNVISVEIVPGASCQMRLAASVGKVAENDKATENQVEKKSVRERELEVIVAQFLSVASKAQDLLPTNTKEKREQPSLFQNDPLLSSKAPRKRARGGAGFDR